ncbi:DGQHR domain-containing protein [Streptomyces sp. 3MP-14]|uniref:DGQHR domain-containing protein n=1 Tax=Streptomyces mimosae TaxID=2586635 RepID=A0A5N6ASY8_9ACTN|nr:MULTISPECIES: DGQHR domain-containing protein DpdB [Streptomyces]KAB8170798.1 DGQHR domain-containing protein [Streptomyces mimosae]KAB8179849.1 DGQHR domain-containing protein [Streptomyces sp. 3MP-14]
MADRYELKLPALKILQGSKEIYCFAVDGKTLHDFTAVSRVRRDDEKRLQGYQRPEVLSHIRSIRRYLESDGAMLPNALVLAFDERVRFEPVVRAGGVPYSVPGELIIPVDESLADDEKPAWLVDGQQRSAAIRDADVAEFPVAAVGFIAAGQEEQRSQFILVNSTKPLPKGLVYELLPETTGQLPRSLARRQLAARLMVHLNMGNGPFCGRISSPTSPTGDIKDNSVLKMLEHSIYEGALFQYRNASDGTGDETRMLAHVLAFWTPVATIFRDAWEMRPKDSRLTHGVGIQAMGFVMDRLTADTPVEKVNWDRVRTTLRGLEDHVAWTSGTWLFPDGEERRWNSLQNTSHDVRMLSTYLQARVIG